MNGSLLRGSLQVRILPESPLLTLHAFSFKVTVCCSGMPWLQMIASNFFATATNIAN